MSTRAKAAAGARLPSNISPGFSVEARFVTMKMSWMAATCASVAGAIVWAMRREGLGLAQPANTIARSRHAMLRGFLNDIRCIPCA